MYFKEKFFCILHFSVSLGLYLLLYHINSDDLTEIAVNTYEFVIAVFSHFATTI